MGTAINHGVNSKPSLKERQRALRCEAILDAATRLISERGYGSVTLEQIADEACVSKPTLYQHYRSKEDVIINLSLRCLRVATERLFAIPDSLPVRERMDKWLEEMVSISFEPNIAFSIDLAQSVLPIRHGVPELAEAENALMDASIRVFAAAQNEGHIRADLPVEFLCQLIAACVKHRVYDFRTPDPEAQRLFHEHLRALLRP